MFAGETQPFILELPAYHLSKIDNVLRNIYYRTKSFISKARSVIFTLYVLIWVLSNFNFQLQMVDQNHSILRTLGDFLAPIFKPLGFGDWQMTIACLMELIAKENCISSLSVAYGGLKGAAFHHFLALNYSVFAGYAFLVFNLLCAPCFAMIGAMYREFGKFKWTVLSIAYQILLVYCEALLIYQGSLIITNQATLVTYALCLGVIIFLSYGFCKKSKE